MSGATFPEDIKVPKAYEPVAVEPAKESLDVGAAAVKEEDFEIPTEHELETLRRVSGKIPWAAYTIAFVELCERFSYYGTTAVFVNFLQQPLPEGSNTGAGHSGQSGALGMGQRASTGLTTFNQFWAYVMPLFGAYMADQHWGRFKTIQIACAVALVGHAVLILSAIPPIIVHPNASIACFTIGLIIMGVGVGGTETVMRVKTTPTGQRVIMDPAVTVSRVFLYFYMMINVGSLTGSIGMVYAEKYVGFWLSFTLPTLMLLTCPIVIMVCKPRYVLTPPTGSTLAKAGKLWSLAMKGKWSWNPVRFRANIKAEGFWDNVMPSRLGARKPEWMTFDDVWVQEVRRGLIACRVFLWYPLYWLAYGQMTNNLTSQAATMKLGGVPNDIVSNFNPLFIVILIPLMDHVIYPAFRRAGINFSPIKRITCGFFLASMAMISACVVQSYIYKQSPCGDNNASSCTIPIGDPDGEKWTSNISVWVQILPYGLIGFSEILASVTSLEYAFTKAPVNMRSTITAVALFMNAISSALAQALTALAEDPLLVWNYGVVAIVAFIGGVLFFLDNKEIDAQDDELNMLPESHFKTAAAGTDPELGEKVT
ncbi:putative MFS peptide transporter [Diplocarpon rosae]|nr:putative MFS peptide transporter [Diplocarpon rosae]